jgi:hypothetical protein
MDYDFSTAAANAGPHVYLIRGTYEGTAVPSTSAPVQRANVNVAADCAAVLVISDNELVCTLDLTASLLATGAKAAASAYRSGLTLSGGTTSNIITSSTPIFSLADAGKAISGSGLQANTTITKVIDGYSVVVDKTPSGAVSTSITIGYSATNIVVTSTAAGATTLNAASGTPFSTADIGRMVVETSSGTKIPAGTYIVGVNNAGTTVTLSQPVAAAVVGVDISSASAVPNGAYNVQLISNALPGASSTDSVISGGSTFTVANF